MAFLDEVDTLTTRLHLSRARIPALIGLTAAVIVILGLGAFAAFRFFDSPRFFINKVDEASSLEVDSFQNESAGDTSALNQSVPQICVHVAGAIVTPGVVTLDEGSRVQDALDKAGGVTDSAFTDSLNLARVLTDGEQIIVPTYEDLAQDLQTNHTSSNTNVSDNVAGSQSSSYINGKLNINRASSEELDGLPGVGPSTAEKIVADRELMGPFKSPEDLKRVSGIGDKKFASLADSICVG